MIIPCGYCNKDLNIPLIASRTMIAWECPVCNAFMILSTKVSKDIRHPQSVISPYSLDFLQLLPNLQRIIVEHLFGENRDLEEVIDDIVSFTANYGTFFVTTAWRKNEFLNTSTLAKILNVTVDRAGKIIKGNPVALAKAKRNPPINKKFKKGRWVLTRDYTKHFLLETPSYPSPKKFLDLTKPSNYESRTTANLKQDMVHMMDAMILPVRQKVSKRKL